MNGERIKNLYIKLINQMNIITSDVDYLSQFVENDEYYNIESALENLKDKIDLSLSDLRSYSIMKDIANRIGNLSDEIKIFCKENWINEDLLETIDSEFTSAYNTASEIQYVLESTN